MFSYKKIFEELIRKLTSVEQCSVLYESVRSGQNDILQTMMSIGCVSFCYVVCKDTF